MTRGGVPRFITLEGGEGAGKSTLARAIAAHLTARSIDHTLTREPGGSPGADAIRALLVRGDGDRWSPLTETLLFAAARNDHLERTIRPALARGDVVICDRYVDSTRAYQISGHGVPEAALDALNALTDAPSPDLTFLLDIDPRIGLARSRGGALGEDRYEHLDLAFHERVRAAFLAFAAAAPDRFVVLDATAPTEAIAQAAIARIGAAA